MSANPTLFLFEKLAGRLANLSADFVDAANPKAKAIARAKFEGYVEAAHIGLTAIGAFVGPAPFAVEMDVIEAENIAGRRPPQSTFNEARKAWHATMVGYLISKWSDG